MPAGYAREILGISPWAGANGQKGQLELFEDIGESVRLQLAGEPANKIFRVEAGHGVGKTYGAAALVNWFFDCFTPSIIYTTAPTGDQVEKLLWKDIKSQRPKSLPGRVLPSAPYMEKAPNHFAIGRTTDDSGGQGTERFQGQHGEFLFFVLDEAEGVSDFVFDAVNAMMTGGTVVLALMLANPRTRTSRFAKLASKAGVQNYRLSVLDHPNVVEGRDVVPGATRRQWVDDMIADHCEVVARHNEDEYTFEVAWRPGVIFLPDAEFLFRVMGIAPKNLADNTLIPSGRFEAACARPAPGEDHRFARMGVDVARFGSDIGTGYVRHAGVIRRFGRWAQQDTNRYAGDIKDEARRLRDAGVRNLHIRVDGGGGFGGGVIDRLVADTDLGAWFPDGLYLFEVHNNGVPYNGEAYEDLGTEMYAEAAETLKGIRVESPPPELEEDLTARKYDWKNKRGIAVKRLEAKDKFKKRVGRSPDDGDGFVLCAAPDFLFLRPEEDQVVEYYDPTDITDY